MRPGSIPKAVLIVFMACLASGIAGAQAPVEVTSRDWSRALPDDEGKGLLLGACTQCHSLNPVVHLRRDEAAWRDTVVDMVSRGAQLHVDEFEVVTKYLTRHLGPGAPSFATAEAQSLARPAESSIDYNSPAALPEGEGKAVVMASCIECHALDRITLTRKSRAAWEASVRDMERLGATIPEGDMPKLITYLTRYFGAND